MRRHPLDHPVSYYAIFLAVRCLPISLCHWLGKVVVLLVFTFSKKDRQGLAVNLAAAMGKAVDDPQVNRTIRQVFINYGRYMVDFFLLPQLPPRKLQTFFSHIRGENVLQEALAKGKGAILLSAHVGNWEVGGCMLHLLNYPFAVVVMGHNSVLTNTLVNRLRCRNGIKVITADKSPFSVIQVLRYLNRNGIVAMSGDRDYFGTGQAVRFLGKKITLPVGPVRLAMKSGAALIPAFVLKQADGRYFGVLESAIPLVLEGKQDEAITRNLEMSARIFEKYIRRFPDQWYCPDPLISAFFPGT